ncbi:MAG: PD-(D/E)XK nuclease family protein [Hyphomicrobium sp.]
MPVTASDLYDYVQCPHRVTMNLVGDPSQRDPVSPFVELLWERGNAYEREVIARLSQTETIVDLSSYKEDEKERRTLEAMREGADLIYSGRISSGDLVGIPDLLKREGEGYVPVDIKSGRGEEGGDDDTDPKPKLHYAVQLALYVDILERLGLSAGRYGFILDINGEEVRYDLSGSRGPRKQETLWQEYQEALSETRAIYDRRTETLPAYASVCKLCHWYSSCLKALRDANDLTLIPRLGRTSRDVLADEFPTVSDLAECNPDAYVRSKNKTMFQRVGAETLRTYHARAKLLATPGAKPYLKQSVRPCQRAVG